MVQNWFHATCLVLSALPHVSSPQHPTRGNSNCTTATGADVSFTCSICHISSCCLCVWVYPGFRVQIGSYFFATMSSVYERAVDVFVLSRHVKQVMKERVHVHISTLPTSALDSNFDQVPSSGIRIWLHDLLEPPRRRCYVLVQATCETVRHVTRPTMTPLSL